MVKTCSRHGEVDHVLEVDKRRGTERWRCRKCRGNRSYRSQRRRKAELIVLLGGQCKICGYNKSIWALDFHHREKSTKSFQISRCLGRSKETLAAEAMKCDLLCRNCHAEIEESEWREYCNGSIHDCESCG